MANWKDQPLVLLLKGDFYVNYAWDGRGGGYANTVTDEGWKLFAERLAIAAEVLEKSYAINPTDERVARLMMRVELGQGEGRDRMELWFQRAMALNTNNYDACSSKLFYLEPKWYGSAEEMLEFGRECVASQKWGGWVPLILADAHEQIVRYLEGKSAQEAYWKQPEVWADIKASFERFFEVCPGATGWRHNYARYAYRCQRWDDLAKQIELLGEVNYEYFGGKEEFEKMVRLAKQKSNVGNL